MNVPIRLFNTALTLLAEIDDYESLVFDRSWYDAGQFEITINKNKLYASLLAKDVIIMVGDRADSVGIITEIKKRIGEEGKGSEEITAIGYELKYIFNRRNVEPMTGKARYAIPGDIDIIADAGNPIFNYDFNVNRVMVGDTCHIYYTDAGTLYHRTATDVLCNTWGAGGACTIGGSTATNCAYPYVFYSGTTYYLILQKTNDASPYSYYMYTSSDGIAWTITNGGAKVLTAGTGIYTYTWGCSIIVVDGVMYFFAECATTGDKAIFGIGYSYAALANLGAGTCNFNTNATATHIIANAGSPNAIYVPDSDAVMLFHSYVNYDDITYWQLRVSYNILSGSPSLISGWTTSNNWGLLEDSTNIQNPNFLVLPASKTYDILLGYLYNNASNYQAYFDMTANDFYNVISANIPAETVIKQLVLDQAGTGADVARRFPNLSIATDQARGDPYVLSARYSILWNEMQDFVYATNISPGITIDLVNKLYVFDVNEGVDRTATQTTNGRAIFSPDFDNLKGADFTESDINYRNLFIVGGKGAGTNRYILKYFDDTVAEPTGFSRREVFIDAREIEDFALRTRAKNELENYINQNTFDLDGLEYSGLQYRTDYDVGDICTVVALGTSVDVRLSSVTEAWEHGSYELAHTFGKPYPTLTSQTANSQSETNDSLSATESTSSGGSSSSTGGTTTTIQVVQDEISNLNEYVLFGKSLSGDVVPHADSEFTYNPYSGTLSAIKFDSTNLDVSGTATIATGMFTSQKLAQYTIPGSTNKILQFRNLATGQTAGDIFSIFEIRSPDTATTEATLSQHVVIAGTEDWVHDISTHNYDAGNVKAVDVLSHFTGTNAGTWEWVSRYTNGTDYSMIDKTVMTMNGVTGKLSLDSIGGYTANLITVPSSIAQSGDFSFYNDFTSGILGSGWRIDYGVALAGESHLEVDNITVRNTLRTHIFQKDVVKVTNGYLYISDSVVAVSVTGTTGAGTITVDDSKSASFDTFPVSMWFKDANTSGVVKSVKFTLDSINTASDGEKTIYDITYVSGDSIAEIPAGGVCARTSGGSILLDASSAYSPFIDISNGTDIKARLGNLDGITSAIFGELTGYGLWSDNVYLEGSINAVGGEIGAFSIDSDSIFTGTKVASGNYAAAGDMTLGSDGHLSSNQFRLDTDGSAYFKGAITGGTIAIGSGDSIFKADSNGIYLGDAAFADAPFRVSMAGVLEATGAVIRGTAIIDNGIFNGSLNTGAFKSESSSAVATWASASGTWLGSAFYTAFSSLALGAVVPTTSGDTFGANNVTHIQRITGSMRIFTSNGKVFSVLNDSTSYSQTGSITTIAGGTNYFKNNILVSPDATPGTLTIGTVDSRFAAIFADGIRTNTLYTDGAITTAVGFNSYKNSLSSYIVRKQRTTVGYTDFQVYKPITVQLDTIGATDFYAGLYLMRGTTPYTILSEDPATRIIALNPGYYRFKTSDGPSPKNRNAYLSVIGVYGSTDGSTIWS